MSRQIRSLDIHLGNLVALKRTLIQTPKGTFVVSMVIASGHAVLLKKQLII